jgi:hypothetical protein
MWKWHAGSSVLVRRISRNFKEQNWFAVWPDVIIVFLGVFIGLQADNWNEARIVKATANSYYARLIEDFRAEESTRLARIAYYQRTKRHGEAALHALDQPDSALREQFLIDIYQATQTWNYTPQRATYDELLSGNIANVIRDAVIRSRLANYYVSLESAKILLQERTPFRNNLRFHMPHAVQSIVREICGDRYDFQNNNIVRITLPESCEVTLDPLVISESISALRSYADLENDLTRHLADLDGKLLNLDAFLSPTREILTQLEEISR